MFGQRAFELMPDSSIHAQWTDVRAAEDQLIGPRVRNNGVVGLAISGGGVRSATFALGVLERLKDRGVLEEVHYLSTVSGGGYIGAWLSANCRRQPAWLTSDWTASIRHLRRYSNYLAPQISLFSADTWSMLTIWLRNATLIQSTVILAMACALILPRPLFWVFTYYPAAGLAQWVVVFLFVLAVASIAGNHWQMTAGRGPSADPAARRRWRAVDLLRARSWPVGLAAAALLFAAAWGVGRLLAFAPFAIYQVGDPTHTAEAGLLRTVQGGLIAGLLVLSGFSLHPVAVRIGAWVSPDRPEQLNYTQGHVQITVVTPLMIVALLVTSVLWAQATGRAEVTSLATLTEYERLVAVAWQYWPFHLSIVFVSFWLLSFFAVSDRREPRRILIAMVAPAVAVLVLHGMLAAIVLLFQGFHRYVGGERMAFVWGPSIVTIAFVSAILVLLGILGRDSTDGVREWWSRLAAWLAIYATAWTVIAVTAVHGPTWVSWLLEQLERSRLIFALLGAWAATVAGGLIAGKSLASGGRPEGAGKLKRGLANVAPFVFTGGALLAVAYVIHLIVVLYGGTDWWREPSKQGVAVPLLMLAVSLSATILLAARVDINDFSIHAFYRNRLVRAYLGATRDHAQRRPQSFTGFDDTDDLPLAFAESETLSGPFHIVNCALSLGLSSDLRLQARPTASFTLTPLFCGTAYVSRDEQERAAEIGFLPSTRFGHRKGGPTVGEAMSISGTTALNLELRLRVYAPLLFRR